MAERIPAVVLLGNDVHLPLNEMAGRQVEWIRSHFGLPASRVVSLQSRKPAGADSAETIIRGSPAPVHRLRQVASLFRSLGAFPHDASRIIHFVGNGNLLLRLALAAYARLTGRALLFSPLGRLSGPWPKNAHVLVPHRALLPAGKQNWHVLPPCAPDAEPAQGRAWSDGKILFCSVPPKAAELDERGLPFLLAIWRALEASGETGATLTILNRYSWMSEPLEELVASFGLRSVSVVTEHIADMSEYLRGFAALVVPGHAEHLAQVPQSALEACAAGLPCLVVRGVAFGEDIAAAGAGAVFGDGREFIAAIARIRANYPAVSAAATALVREHFARDAVLRRLGELYAEIEFAPPRPYHGGP